MMVGRMRKDRTRFEEDADVDFGSEDLAQQFNSGCSSIFWRVSIQLVASGMMIYLLRFI